MQLNKKSKIFLFNKIFIPKDFKISQGKLNYKYYNQSSFFKSSKNALRVSEMIFMRSVFVSGHAYSFYRGSITPFINLNLVG